MDQIINVFVDNPQFSIHLPSINFHSISTPMDMFNFGATIWVLAMLTRLPLWNVSENLKDLCFLGGFLGAS